MQPKKLTKKKPKLTTVYLYDVHFTYQFNNGAIRANLVQEIPSFRRLKKEDWDNAGKLAKKKFFMVWYNFRVPRKITVENVVFKKTIKVDVKTYFA